MDAQRENEVLIAGGGPVGLALALFLDAYGVKSTIFNTETTTRWHPKGNTHNQRTMEHFRRFGLAAGIRDLGMPWDHPLDVAYFTRLSAHEIARFRVASKRARLEACAERPRTDQMPEPMHRINQMYMERFLLERALAAANITVRFGCEVASFAHDRAGVTVTARDMASGAQEVWRGQYLVGCDGGRSTVRRALGIRFGGEDALKDVFFVGQVTSIYMRIPEIEKFVGHRRAWMYLTVNPDTRGVIISLDGSQEFMMHRPVKGEEPVDEAEVARTVQRAIGVDTPVDIIGAKPWYAGGFLVADRFQDGRVLLAGDAIHLFTPNGGFGLNTGIDDVANLAWKLAAVTQGWGGPGLIETYETERRPIALRNTQAARQIGKIWHDIKVTSTIEEDSADGEAARAEAARSSFVVDNHFVLPEESDSLGVILGVRYDGSPLIAADGPPPEDTLATYTPSSLPGGRAPHLWIGPDGERASLFDEFGLGFTLLRHADAKADHGRLEQAARRRNVPLKVVTIDLPEARALYPKAFTLIRPDQHVAWRGDQIQDEPDRLFDQLLGFRTPAMSDA